MKEIEKINFHIPELELMRKYPQDLYYIGNLELLKKKKIGVVGSRKTNSYAREVTHRIVSKLAQGGNIIISGGAIGIDSVAHKAATPSNTIMIAGTGLDKRYPAINKNMIVDIEKEGLVLSQFAPNTPSLPRNFAIRNELIVALSDILLVSYADIKSGTMRSVEYALKMDKKIFVLPHRLGESDGTNQLLGKKKATAIYDLDQFIDQFVDTKLPSSHQDTFLEYCSKNPIYDEAVKEFGDKVFEYELLGKIDIKNGKIYLA